MTMTRTGLPSRFAAFFEMRTRNGIVNRLPPYNNGDEASTDYTLLCGLFEAVRTNQRDQYRICPDPQMRSRLFHDAQLTRSSNELFEYGDAVGMISNRNDGNTVRRVMRFSLTPYSLYIDTNQQELFPVVLFDLRTTEALMDTTGSSSRSTMPSMTWIHNLLMERRNIVEDIIYDNNINNEDIDFYPPTRYRNNSWGRRAGGGGGAAGGGGGGAGGGPYGAGGYGIHQPNYYQPYPNINTYYNIQPPDIPNSISGGAAGGAGSVAAGGASRSHHRNDSVEDTAGRPLETFVAEALLREAMRTHMTCAISMEPIENRGFVVTNCFHIFQQEALEQWAESHSNCPVCRAALVYRPVSVSLPQ